MDSCTMDIKVDIKGVLDLYNLVQLYVFPSGALLNQESPGCGAERGFLPLPQPIFAKVPDDVSEVSEALGRRHLVGDMYYM